MHSTALGANLPSLTCAYAGNPKILKLE